MSTLPGPTTPFVPPDAEAGARGESRGSAAETLHSGPAGFAELAHQLQVAVVEMGEWMGEYGTFRPHSSLDVSRATLERECEQLRTRLRDNYPFFHPRYVGQMLKPPHPAAVIG